MHCRKVRTEYMKRFREPPWAAFGQCYEELLRYRLSRRLLEQAHRPWLWEDWEQGSDSSAGAASPPEPSQPDTAAPVCPQPATSGRPEVPAETGSAPLEKKTEAEGGERGDQRMEVVKEKEKQTNRSRRPPSQRASSCQDGHKLVRSPERIDYSRELRQPFALYASGEKRKDTGSQKTHNVCAPTSANEIHDSALRAKNRRQKEKRKLLLQKQRAHTADVERNLMRKSSPPENPWLTEYMRCYSARAR